MRVPSELFDEILSYCPLQLVIALRRPYLVRKRLCRTRQHSVVSYEHAKWLYENDVQGHWPRHAYGQWSYSSDLSSVAWLLSVRHDALDKFDHEQAIRVALLTGHYPMAQFLCEQGFSSPLGLLVAVRIGHLPFVEALSKDVTDVALLKEAIETALYFVRIDTIRILRQKIDDDDLPVYYLDNYIREGAFDTIQYLHFHLNAVCTPAALRCAISYRQWDIARFLCEHRPEDCSSSAIIEAIGEGNLEMVKFLVARLGTPCALKYALSAAVMQGDLELVRYVMENVNRGCPNAIDMAACRGYTDIVRYLYTNFRYRCTSRAMDVAAGKGHFAIVRHLNEEQGVRCTPIAIKSAAEFGHLDIVQYLDEHANVKSAYHPMNAAARNGHFEIVKYLHAARYKFTVGAMNEACANGHLQIVQFLHEKRGDWWEGDGGSDDDKRILNHGMDDAASNGHLDVVRYLDKRTSTRCTTDAIDSAASHGHLSVVAYLCENRNEGCTTQAMDSAARNGHADIVKYLHFKGKACTTGALDAASRNGHLSIVEFLCANRSEGSTHDAAQSAAEKGDVLVLQCLHRFKQIHYPILTDLAAQSGHFEVLQYLHEHDLGRFTSNTMDIAARGGFLDIVRYLHHERQEGCTTAAIDWAVESLQTTMVHWLAENRNEGCTIQAFHNAAEVQSRDMLCFLLDTYPEFRRHDVISQVYSKYSFYSMDVYPSSIGRYLRELLVEFSP